MPFSSEWLALREPADHLARDRALLQKACLAAGSAPVVLDLGCGTGSNVRALAPWLPQGTKWHLVDNDPGLLEIAAKKTPGEVHTHCIDLTDLAQLPIEGVTLVTGSALLDLVSKNWFRKLVSNLNAPVYFALSYDGEMVWDPMLPDDQAITESFNEDQRTDKGLGTAMGPDSPALASEILEANGFVVERAKSDWRLAPNDSTLQSELVLGIASAAAEAGNVAAKTWGDERVLLSSKSYCTIGHEDILAVPQKR